ncbi:MAG: thioredoxin family protein [Butyrivibrio sp.]|nr:thioredoxin family protein [Butyrivibrio sp.]
MKQVLMMIQESCPYCRKARKFMEELQVENPKYAELDIRMVDENIEVDFANSLDYYYVPTYYVDGKKVHEGAASRENVRAVLDAALKK